MPEPEKEMLQDREKPASPMEHPEQVPGRLPVPSDDESSRNFFGEPLVGFDPHDITGTLIVIEGMDGSGRSTQISLLQEWLESEGFAVQTSGLRRSTPVGRRIYGVLAQDAVNRPTF